MQVVRILSVLAVVACSSKRQDAPIRRDNGVAPPRPSGDAAPSTADAAPVGTRSARAEHAAFDLIDNRHLAHRVVDGELVIDAGRASFARYMRFGSQVSWALGRVIDGQRVAIPGPVASLEVPLDVEQAGTSTQLTLRIHSAGEGRALAVKINGRAASKAAAVVLAEGWQTIAIPIDPGRLVVGENMLTIEGGRERRRGTGPDPAAIGVAWMRIGIARPLDAVDPRQAMAYDATKRTLELARDAGLTWFVALPEGAHLVASVADGCAVDVRARPSAGAVEGGQLIGMRAAAPGTTTQLAAIDRVDLSAMAGNVVALTLTARDCDRATVAAPRITIGAPAPAALPVAPPPKLVVLWVMDALRADKIRAFTPGARADTPVLDELARTSVVFRQYYVQGNESQTSHSSVWSGVYPAVHQVRLAGKGGTWKLSDRFDLIATRLGGAGFATEAVTGNGFVTSSGGYARGFQKFRNMMREDGIKNGTLLGDKVVDAALARIAARRPDPTYMFLGTVDTHAPWIARKPWIDRYSPGPYDGPFKLYGTAKELGFQPGRMGCSIIPPAADIERLRAIYDSAISYQDHQLGRFIDQLKAWGLWDATMLIITADHGEELFEDDRCGHGGSLRESLVRVPLLIHDPARFPGGTIVDEGVEGVDILPTVLEAVGAPAVAAAQGESLVARAQGVGKGWGRPSYASMYEYAHAMRIGRWKIRVGVTGAPMIHDLVEDPGEHRDVSAVRPIERRMLTDHVGLFLAMRKQWNKTAWGPVTNLTAAGAAALDEASAP